ncbi:MAG: hypothetical protein RDV48_28585 [Candidatus Eremiobacteraeota bacterium]|nr:hypothetical protein [Candidatus Eremiobacteraeota bacterium]
MALWYHNALVSSSVTTIGSMGFKDALPDIIELLPPLHPLLLMEV